MKGEDLKKNWGDVNLDDTFLPGIAIDTVIFGFHENKMMVLLLQYKNTRLFALPGGFINKEEDADNAAKRILQDRTGLSNIYLEQFYTFGDNHRQDNSLELILKARGLEPSKDHFLLKRFISIGYYALVDFTKAIPVPDYLSDDCKWHDINKIPVLIQDHNKIIEKALDTLRDNLDKKLVGFKLMPETFTMRELQGLYETVLDTELRRTSFQRKMLNLDILKLVDKKMTGGAHKAPYLYTFKAL
jgi:8-oxo-dGTP diphosphatase